MPIPNFPRMLGIPNMACELHKQARPEGLEPPTLGLEVRRSIHLSYGRRCCDHSSGPAPRSGRRAVNSLHPRRNAALAASDHGDPVEDPHRHAPDRGWLSGENGTLRMVLRKPLRGVQELAIPRRIATVPLRRYRRTGARYQRRRQPTAKTGPIRIMDVSGP